MRRSMIAVCLLLGLPSPACACMDDHKNGEWLDEKTPSTSWEIARTSAEGYPREESLRVCAIAVGSASAALAVLWLPAVSRARGRRRVKQVELDFIAPGIKDALTMNVGRPPSAVPRFRFCEDLLSRPAIGAAWLTVVISRARAATHACERGTRASRR
jgi:hypothetical protein